MDKAPRGLHNGLGPANNVIPTGGSTTFSGMIQGGGTLGASSLVLNGSGMLVVFAAWPRRGRRQSTMENQPAAAAASSQ